MRARAVSLDSPFERAPARVVEWRIRDAALRTQRRFRRLRRASTRAATRACASTRANARLCVSRRTSPSFFSSRRARDARFWVNSVVDTEFREACTSACSRYIARTSSRVERRTSTRRRWTRCCSSVGSC